MITINDLEIKGKTVKKKNKPKNGDSFKFDIINNHIVALSVADGVSKSPCDWLASDIACDKFIEMCNSYSDNLYSEETLAKIISIVNTSIINSEKKCKGSLSVFSAVVWNINYNYFYYISIGDTRIYKYSQNNLTQISTDDTKYLVYKDKAGKPVLFSGAYATVSAVTNVLGMQKTEVIIKKENIMSGDSIILSSDGFYDCMPSFNDDIKEIISSVYMQTEIDKVFNKYTTYQKDDTTVLILRRTDTEIKEFNIEDTTLIEQTPNHILSELFLKQLSEAICNNDENKCNKIFETIERKSLKFEKPELEKLIKLMKDNGFNNYKIYRNIVNLIKDCLW